jgi:Divergent InlB B-repeat domain
MFTPRRAIRPISTLVAAAALFGAGPCGGDHPTAPTNDVASVQIIATPTNPRVGETSLVSATPVNAGGVRVQGVPCTYASSTPAVATAIQSGANANVTGIVAGSTTITATCAGKSNSVVITVRPPVVTLTLTALGSGNGTLFANPAVGLGYDAGTVVTVTEFPTSGSVFTGWGGACNGVGACVVVMTANAMVTATFDQRFNLTIGTAGAGTGTVAANPPGLSYAPNTNVTLTAVPSANSAFAGWSGACAGMGNCLITMDANKAATATFTLVPMYTLTLATAPAGGGTVSPNLPGPSYSAGTVVTVTETANTGYTFSAWSGDCSGAGACAVTMNANKSVTATFNGQFAGTWVGTWAWSGPGTNGCTFNDGGAFSMILTQTGVSVSGSVSAAGVQTRNNITCALMSTDPYTGTASGTVSGTTWNFSFGLGGPTSFPGTATLNNNTLTASFVRTTGGSGSFTLTRQ